MAVTSGPGRRDNGGLAAVSGAFLGALAMSSCCILPLVLFSLGATGAWIGELSALSQYRWLFVSFAVGSLGFGYWRVYVRNPRLCAAGTSCARRVVIGG